MSVCSCYRKNCNNIADRYSDCHGYICNECFSELVLKRDSISVEEFMKSEKPNESPKDMDFYEFYGEIFPLQYSS